LAGWRDPDTLSAMTLPITWCLLAAAGPRVQDETFFEKYPWAWDMLLFFLAVGIVAVIIWYVRFVPALRGFVIHVTEEDITFTGQFPAAMQATVSAFLRQDVALPGTYQVRGHWEGRLLIVVVKGEHARPMEQRIRNFLKLNLKPPM
jgi:hypothetical protein